MKGLHDNHQSEELTGNSLELEKVDNSSNYCTLLPAILGYSYQIKAISGLEFTMLFRNTLGISPVSSILWQTLF